MSSLENFPPVTVGLVARIERTITITEEVRKTIVGITRKGSVSNFRKRTDMLTEIIMAFTDINILAFLSAISLNLK